MRYRRYGWDCEKCLTQTSHFLLTGYQSECLGGVSDAVPDSAFNLDNKEGDYRDHEYIFPAEDGASVCEPNEMDIDCLMEQQQ